jgi:hypothetical protein
MGDTRLLPARLLSAVPRRIVDLIDRHAAATKTGKKHHPAVYASCAEVRDVAVTDVGFALFGEREPSRATAAAAMAVACAAWRRSQGVFRFDASLAHELERAGLGQLLPADVLTRLPAHCVWVEDEGAEGGFFAFVDDTVDGLELCLLGNDGGGVTVAASLPLGCDLRGAIQAAEARTGIAFGESGASLVAAMVARAVYLCSEESDVDGQPSRLNATRTRNSKPPFGPTVYHVGQRIGAALRFARRGRADGDAADSGRSPVAHIRRAHWHT